MEDISENSKQGNGILLTAAVVSRSPLMRKRLATVLSQEGFRVTEAAGSSGFLRQKRQRPYVICFLDVRGPGGCERAQRCFDARPGERYVLISDSQHPRPDNNNGRCKSYGCISDSFSSQDVSDWASRAAAEERLSQGEQSLEELLLERFRSFAYQVGSASMSNLHELVMERVERPLFKAVLEWTGGNQSRAAEILGLHRNTLRAKLKALGL
jgi:DNA-binding protein Fis